MNTTKLPYMLSENMTLAMDNNTVTLTSSSSGPSTLTRFICETVIAMPLSILGIIGNILACIVLCRQRPRLSTTVLLQGLAVTDAFVLLCTILLRSLRYIYHYYETLEDFHNVYHYIFRWGYPFVYFFRLTCMWFTVLLTIDRFVAVCRPLHAQSVCTLNKTYRNILLITISSLLFSIPRFFEYQIDLDFEPFKFKLTTMVENQAYTIAYRITLFFLVMYHIPVTILVILNSKLLLALKEAASYRANIRQTSGTKFGPKSNRSITVIVVSVVSICIICNLTAMISHLIWSLEECYKETKKFAHLAPYRRYLSLISNILVTFNSAVNFIIYCLCSRNFRRILVHTCKVYRIVPRPRRGRWGSRNSQSQRDHNSTYVSLLATQNSYNSPKAGIKMNILDSNSIDT